MAKTDEEREKEELERRNRNIADVFAEEKQDPLDNLKDENDRKKVIKHMETYRYRIPAEHLNVFATRNPTSSDLFIYCFSNRRLINNMHSSLEIEVLKWDE